MRRQRPPEPHNRDGIWYLFRKVPKEFQAYDSRVVVRISTDIRVVDDPRAVRARPAVLALDRELHAYWRGRRDGRDDEARRRFDEARDRARQFDIPYQTAGELAGGTLDEILRRVGILLDRGNIENETDFAAALGGEERPKLMLSGLQAEFETIESAALKKMNETQRRKASGTRSRSVTNFMAAIGGDKALADLTRTDGIAFRVALQGRVNSGKIEIVSANREMGTVSKMLKTVSLTNQIDIPAIFRDLRIKGAEDKQRVPFSPDWIRTKILAPGALDGLNAQARAIILLMIDHGMRPSEAHDTLVTATIHLEAAVPHISIEPIDKILKTPESRRKLPLVGAGPELMKRHRDGFPRYRGKASFSAAVNSYFRENGLMETPAHTIYGLRHSFEDRLTAIEAPERVTATLMGHKWHRPKYGAGPTLKQLQRWLLKISLTSPQHLPPRA